MDRDELWNTHAQTHSLMDVSGTMGRDDIKRLFDQTWNIAYSTGYADRYHPPVRLFDSSGPDTLEGIFDKSDSITLADLFETSDSTPFNILE